jgi:type I restriction enzyme S subunit
MKEGWEYKKIKEVGTVIGGTTPNTSNKEYWGGDNCWISPAELDGSHYLYDSKKKITDKAVKEKNLKLLPVGTVILSSRAPIGKVTINKVPTYCNQGFKCVVCGKDLYNEFLYWWFWGHTNYLNSIGKGATFVEISKTVVENIEIPVPPLSEQQRIVSYLDSAFAKIDAVAKNAEDSLNEAKALFQSALAKMMEPKEGWKEKLLGEVCDTVTDFVAAGSFADLRKNVVYQNSLSYAQLVRTTDLKSQFRKGHFVYVTKDAFNYLYRVNLNEVSIILPNVGVNCGEVYYVDPNMLPYENNVLGPNAVLVKSKLLNMKFLSYAFKDKFFQKQLSNITSNMAQPKFNKTALKKLTIVFPPIENQKAISDELDIIASKIKIISSNLSRTLAECSALKQSILRQTFE